MSKDAKTLYSVFVGRLDRLFLVCVASYVAICIGCGFFQRSVIYFPPHLAAEQVDGAAKTAGLDRRDTPAGQAIGMKRMSPKQPADGRVLITYGNGSYAVGCAHYAN